MKKKDFIVFTILSALLTIGFVLCGGFLFGSSYKRLFETFGDLWRSLVYYVTVVLNLQNGASPSVTVPSKVLSFEVTFPEAWAAFVPKAEAYLTTLLTKENLYGYLGVVGKYASKGAKILCLLLPAIVVLIILIRKMYASCNTSHDVDTKPLRVHKWLMRYTFQPVRLFCKRYIGYLKEHSQLITIWVLIWLCNLNLIGILVAFFAYYFYFIVSFKFDTLYFQIYKLAVDLQVVIRVIPLWLLLIGAYLYLLYIRANIAERKLRHMEARNCGFIKELPLVSLTCGTMGVKKTTTITDMALSQEVMFRQKALELLERNDMKFPRFPWILFEKDIQKQMEDGVIFNLASTRRWMETKRKAFEEEEDKKTVLYDYDGNRYGYIYDDGLRVAHLLDILETYAQLYFIYIIETSLILSNYSIRVSSGCVDQGNFPMWVTDFFPKDTDTTGEHSHILDFDILRLGKKVIENNPNAGSFEFGVLVISEIGKERGNNLELREVKRGEERANQKNDLFNAWLKMCRHSSTIDNFPFIKVFADEQRPESWGADARDLCEIIRIRECSEIHLAMPFYTIEEMLSEWVVGGVTRLYYDFRFRRGDNTLLMHLLKGLASWLYRRNLRYYNRFGYYVSNIEVESGTMDRKRRRKKYFLMSKKIYSRRFSTDCFSDYFSDQSLASKRGIMDYGTYETERATVDELRQQNSYFISALYPATDESEGDE